MKMRLCFGYAACYDPRGDYCKGCDDKSECSEKVKEVIASFESAEEDKKVHQKGEAELQKEKFAEKFESLAKHPKKLVGSLFQHGYYLSADILNAGQRHEDRKMFWKAVSLLKSGGFKRSDLLEHAMEHGMSKSTAQSEVTAVIKALDFYGMIEKDKKEYRLL